MQQGYALIIDDDADIRQLMSDIVRILGYEAITVESGAEFREAYDRRRPEFIVLDIIMPGESGIELLHWLADRGCRSRVVVMSGLSSIHGPKAMRVAEENGIDAVTLNKPFLLRDLRAAILEGPSPGSRPKPTLPAVPMAATPDASTWAVDGRSAAAALGPDQPILSRRNASERASASSAEASWWGG